MEQNVDVPVQQITVPVPFQEEIDEVIKLSPAKRITERTVEHIADVPVPQTLEEDVEVVKAVKIVPQERFSAKICEQIVDAPVPRAVDEPVLPFQGKTDEVIKLFPEERTPKRIIQGFTPGAHLGARTRTDRRSTR